MFRASPSVLPKAYQVGLGHLPEGRCGIAKLVDMRTPLRKKAQLKDKRDGAG